jgi:NADPH:quinone reductase-like Zn-dependent oxidoreductase
VRKFLLAWIALCACLPAIALAAGTKDVPATTRKIVLQKEGDHYRWHLVEVPIAPLGDNQVLLHVRAVSLNRGDVDMLGKSDRDLTGFVPGTDAAGDIVQVGKRVTRARKGMRVTSTYFRNWIDGPVSAEIEATGHGQSIDGVLGEYIVLDETAVMPMLPWMSYEDAVTLPTAGLTAWNALVSERKVRPGDIVLVQGTGGVSMFTVQFAKLFGARVVVTSSSDEKLAKVRAAYGVDDGINYKKHPDWPKQVLQVTGGHGADFIVNIAGKETLAQSTECLAYGGALSIVGGITGYHGEIPAWDLLAKTAQARGIYVGSQADYRRMLDFISKHRMRPVIDRVFPFEQYAAALQHLESGDFIGKVVIRFGAGDPAGK